MRDMEISWIPLAFSLSLLALTLFLCRAVNVRQGALQWNGALFFFVLCILAMILDFTLTMVFASASFHDRTEYESLASRTAWAGRVLTYLIPCVVSLLLALRFRRRQRVARGRRTVDAGRPVQIQTSPYTQSKLTL
ncbi:hypothetical protein [Caballeronia hypogeia]|nr:hypothetical protein [Caballeronia hypogeia]